MRTIPSLLPFVVILVAACNAETGDETEGQNENEGTTASALTTGPDLQVTAVTSPYTNGATVTVCNKGTTYSNGTTADIRLSSDTKIDASDALIGSVNVHPLNAGDCDAFTIDTYPPSVPSGAYYLSAIVDPQNQVAETNENNNTRAGTLLGIGNGADLVVSSVSAPADAAGGFSVTTSICNTGNQPAGASTVAVRLSTDTTIDASDMLGGSTNVYPLYPGQCQTVTVPVNPPYPMGAYYLGVVADSTNQVPELIEQNNTSAARLIGIGPGPDLYVSTVTGPASANGNFTTTATICNQGTQPLSGDAPVEVRLSTDTTIDANDPLVGTGTARYLQPGDCSAIDIPSTANVPAGAYRLGVRVPSVPNEIITTNNTYSARTIAIGNGPDLVVTALSAPADLGGPTPFSATATVCNQGTQYTGNSTLALYFSGDTTITTSDQPGPTANVPYLNAGQCASVPLAGNIPYFMQGTYWLGALIDPTNQVAELNETNNVGPLKQVAFGNNPDLVITKLTGPASVMNSFSGGSATVCNQGNSAVGGAELDVYFSADTTITTGDQFLNAVGVPALDVGACATVDLGNVMVPPTGPNSPAMYLGAIVDPKNQVHENLETNNAFTGKLTGVGYGPDFVISSVSVPPDFAGGANFYASVVVCNQGTTQGATNVTIVASTDTTITTSDSNAGMGPTPTLQPGACATLSIPGNIWGPPNSAYYIGAIADAQNQTPELIESNNTGVSRLMGYGYGPDLYVSSFTAPATVSSMGTTAMTAKVCNEGTAPTQAPTSVDVYVSPGATVSTVDQGAGRADIPVLAVGACATVTVNANIWGQRGATYSVAAIVDGQNYVPELVESNNVSAVRKITVSP